MNFSKSRARPLAIVALISIASSATASAQDKPLVTPKDFGKWEMLGQTRLSPNGNWAAIGVNRVSEENELRIRNVGNDATTVVAFGTQPAFSNDSKWIAYLVGIAPKERERLTREKKPIRNSFVARNLATGDTITAAEVSAFSFSPDGRFVSMTKYPAEGKRVQDVLVHDLSKGSRVVFSNVSEQAWADQKALLAFTVAADGGLGNGIQVYDGSNGTARVLESSPAIYRGISWRPKSEALAVLRSKPDKDHLDTAHAIIAWSSATDANMSPKWLDAGVGTPAGMRVADYRRPSWSKDGNTLYIGLRKREPVSEAPKKGEEKVSDVEIWHPNDVHTIPDQRSSEGRDMRATMVASWRIGDAKLSQIGTNQSENSALFDGDGFATETDTKNYAFGQMFGRRDSDIWITDLSNGSRKKLLEKVRFFYGADPTGRRVSWFDGKDYWTMDVASGARTNLTAKLTAQKVDFVDRDDDHPNNVLPAIGAPLWTKDGSALLVNGEYDVWQLALDGSGGRKLTDGAKERLTHRIVNLGAGGGFGASVADRSVDLSKPVYLALYGKRSKKSGYARLENGNVTRLILDDARVAGLAKADSADRYIFTRQTFSESPNVYMAGSDLANPKALTNTNAFQKDYAWGKAELMNFTSTIGVPLQAILYYPANFDPKKKYPMIVYTYELLSQGLHGYITPRENDYYNANVFTQNGYFVLMPDIVFRPREPGIAVLQAVEPAVRAVIARGLVDPAKVGHAGHSQGGYEAAYLATHSKLFATTVMGSGISDMWSFAGQMHWSSVPEFDHWETGQFRMQVPPWEDVAAMNANSPLNKVNTMYAKSVLVEIGSEDPTVDMRQGVEFYNYARRAGKHVVMLNYPGEGHSLAKRENAVDYERRILQWFAHYLKGEPAAKWITDGQSWIDRKKILDVNK